MDAHDARHARKDIIMKSPVLLTSIGVLVALAGLAPLACAGESDEALVSQDARDDRASDARRSRGSGAAQGMRAVLTTARPGEPGYGWRYFSDPVAATAVVISPQGEHYFSRGDGLRLIAVSQPTP
jgi:hypothetical protein